ncbi:hypothetical protein PsorP6_005330 [Peronosclerospora sorghi]|uniref:Uncharacterized protein n=1 Tax=Peronosclerospora sorghi TaxID=230839 RepID=A0ACC0W353_9STRA|nr:hypothetical protein PsorP6_005330 [Peronosclerospora sorghi]
MTPTCTCRANRATDGAGVVRQHQRLVQMRPKSNRCLNAPMPKMARLFFIRVYRCMINESTRVAVFGLDGVHEIKQLVEAHVRGALETSMYSIECVVALLEVSGAMDVLEEVEQQAEDAAQGSWLVTGTVHVMLQWDTFPDDLDVLILFTLLRQCYVSWKLRRVLCAHVEYKKLVYMLVVVAIDPKAQRWQHSVMKTLTLLCEEKAMEPVTQGVQSSSTRSVRPRCAQCRQGMDKDQKPRARSSESSWLTLRSCPPSTVTESK